MYNTIKLNLKDVHPNLRRINLYQCQKGFDSGIRRLYDHYFLYVHKGRGQITINENIFDSSPGDLYYCAPGISNSIIADEEEPFLLSGINFDFTHNHTQNELLYPINQETFDASLVTEQIVFSDFAGFPVKITMADDKIIREHVLEMIRYYNERTRYSKELSDSILRIFIIQIARTVTSNTRQKDITDKLNPVIDYISENYMHEITNSMLSSLFHYSADHLSRMLLSHTGLTLRQYLIDVRIRAAIDALLYSDISIKDIAVITGHDSIHYFTRIFKAKTGYPPGRFRNNGVF